MPAPKRNQPAPEPEADHTALETGQHNPYLEGLIQEGRNVNDAIRQWYERRDAIRQQARGAVAAGFASEAQAETVGKLWPMPKRKTKAEREAAQQQQAA